MRCPPDPRGRDLRPCLRRTDPARLEADEGGPMGTSPHGWRGFQGEEWRDTIDVGRFIHDNLRPYDGGPEFLAGPTPRTERIWQRLQLMFVEERRRGIYDVDAHTPSTITSHAPGYLDKEH